MDNSVEVRYAGVVVGRGVFKELGADALFVGIPEPLPVGTLVTLKIGDASREARVEDVVESAEPAAVGMRVRWGGAPARPAVVAPAPTPIAAPVAQVADAPADSPSYSAPATSAPATSAPATASGESGPALAVESTDAGSNALPAPLSLASPAGDAQHGGGKKRRKRR